MDSLYLIDVSALAYRSFYAFIKTPLRNSTGKETSAIFGFASHILRLIQECKPTHVAFVKDLPKPTFRHAMYAEYKAHRKPMPESLVQQLPDIDEFVAHSGLRTVALEGFEADDVMATLALQARGRGMKTYIVTRDKDMMQLVDESIFLFELGKAGVASLVVDAQGVKEKMGVLPERIVDYLSLIGDASDNVPGVGKIGPKGAADLLETYGTLEGIYKNVDSITKVALRENLKNDRENAFLSKRLVTLNTDLSLPLGLEELRYQGVNAEALRDFLHRFELKSLIKLIPGIGADTATQVGLSGTAAGGGAAGESTVKTADKGVKVSAAESTEQRTEPLSTAETVAGPGTAIKIPPAELHYTLIDTPEALAEVCGVMALSHLLAVDTETTSLDSKTADLVGICLSIAAESGYYIPVGHMEGRNLSLDTVRASLKPILDHPSRLLLFHNAKYDLPVLERHGLLPAGLERAGKLADTMVAAYLCNPGERNLSLDDLSMRHFGHEMIPIDALIGKSGKGKVQKSFAEVPIADACRYGAEDADITFRLWGIYGKELAEKNLSDLFFGMEMALLPVLLAMENRGITLDVNALHTLAVQLQDEVARLERDIRALGGSDFNVNSPSQLQEILFEKLGLKTYKKTKTGYSTDVEVLSRLEGEHPIIAMLLDHRECSKLKNTYVDALPLMVHPKTGRVHTSYSQVIAATGRLSSINPNLQNIPIRTELGRAVRRCFTAGPPDTVLLCADYSQIELRLLAHLSGDPALLEAYRKGVDIHARTAAGLYKVAENEVTAEMRRSAKIVNFGVLYGMGAHRLSQQLKIPRDEAKRFIENYFATFAAVETYLQATVNMGRELGYVETLAGRRRYLPDLRSDSRMLRENAERIAANTPIQGSAADLIKTAMINIHRRLQEAPLPCAMLLQVHDELVFEVAKSHLEPASAMIKEQMEDAMRLEVPLVVEIGSGHDWMEAHA